MEFVKMHGLGNDFIVISLLDRDVEIHLSQIPSLCQRRFGIGADGILLVLPPCEKGNDFRMKVFNRDGSEAPMCGNGIRCFGHYLYRRGLSTSSMIRIETLAGVMILSKEREGIYTVDMGYPSFEPHDVPVLSKEKVLEKEIQIGEDMFTITSLWMGNPHTVIFVEDVEEIPLTYYGPLIESAPIFPQKTNVEFVTPLSLSELRLRVWERGVGETKACGTGACASVVAAVETGRAKERVKVQLDGGELHISWSKDSTVRMTGPAREVYSGSMECKEERERM